MSKIAAIVLAAGESRRMGRPKVLLSWGKTTILGQIVAALSAGGVDEILVVTGAAREEVEALAKTLAERFPVRTVQNPNYALTDMLGSIQAGLRALSSRVQAALIALGDQPQIQERTVRRVIEAYRNCQAKLVIPSYNQRRGHPWLADRTLWPSILALTYRHTPRDFLHAHAEEIVYVPAEDDSILRDVDTPQQYESEKPSEEHP